jgi:hypothetical protein
VTAALYDKMANKTVYRAKTETKNDRKILLSFNQPLTTVQAAAKTGIPKDTCGSLIAKFAKNSLITCLNPAAGNGRLYWLSILGKKYQKDLCKRSNIPYKWFDISGVDWQLYGSVCFNYRSVIVKTLTTPMQPSQIKHILRIQKPHIKISANNIRDVIMFLLAKQIVRPVRIKRKIYIRYELTELGEKFRRLLIDSSVSLGQNSAKHIYKGDDNLP